MPEYDMWTKIEERCLEQAWEMIAREAHPTVATAEAIKKLVDTAISIDLLDLRWQEWNQNCRPFPLVRSNAAR